MRDQLSTGQKYIESHENMILVDTYIDDGISGQKLKRDDFQRLLDDVRTGKIDLVIFTRLDRWFRNLRHYLNTQDILDKHLTPNDDAQTVAAIFQFYRKNGNLSETLRHIESEFGLVRSAASLKNMLTNPKYIGVFRDNKEYCPAIIERELFEDVQRLLKINIKGGKKHDYIFGGLVDCEDCDHIMSGCQHQCGGRTRADGTRAIYKYSCYRYRQGINLHRCTNRKIVMESTLEAMMLDRIRPELEKYIAEYEVANLPAIRTDAKRRSVENKLQKLKVILQRHRIEQIIILKPLCETPSRRNLLSCS